MQSGLSLTFGINARLHEENGTEGPQLGVRECVVTSQLHTEQVLDPNSWGFPPLIPASFSHAGNECVPG